ncbi:cache domain-containing protein [Boseaceae bacterium BT-24-1]|nr:cache domain-containing protein [Boseaceae bacterium BT-24-1]
MSNRLSLRTLVFVGGAALMLVPALIAGSLYTGALQRRAEAMQVEKLTARGELSASLFARRLHQLWQEVETLSRSVNMADLDGVRRDIDFIGRLDRRYSWIGVTDVQGRVLVSLSGMLQGESVAQRPWFRRGLTGPTAIDVHEAQLLAKLLPATPEPYRFIDFAAPLRRGEGPPDGVLGAHLDWRWVQENLASLQAPGIDVLLLSRDRVVLYGPPDLLNKTLEIGSAQAANRVSSAVLDERWPDGKDYITVVMPTIGHADLPSFGWSLLIRQDIDGALGPTRELVRSFWSTLGAGALVALVLLFLGAAWIATPLRRLAASSEAMVSDAEPKAPYAETRYAEAERLSSALVRLQSRLWTAIGRNRQ